MLTIVIAWRIIETVPRIERTMSWTILFATTVLVSGMVIAQDSSAAPKIDCLPDRSNPTKLDCDSRRCTWQSSGNSAGVPQCFYPSKYPSYTATEIYRHQSGLSVMAQRRAPSSGFPNDVTSLQINVTFLNKNMLRIKISDSHGSTFEAPFPEIDFSSLPKNTGEDPDYEVKVIPEPLSFQVIRKTTQETIFDSSPGALIFSDQYVQLTTLLNTTNIYGLGEHFDRFNRGQKAITYTLFNRGDQVPLSESGFNLYGSHPFYIALEKSGQAHGVFLHNSNAMDIVIQPDSSTLTYRTIGGILDLYFFLGPTPDQVVSQYTSLVGKPFLVPYWTLGFHLCRYGYNTTEEIRATWQRNRDAKIPLDTMWSDIDYMDDMLDFTIDHTRDDKLPQFVDDLHDAGMHFIMNNSPGLSGQEKKGTYPPLDEAKELDILIKDYKGDILEALVWQNATVMLDFSNPKIDAFWEKYFQKFHDQIKFDAAWIDMNEPYSFMPGSHEGCPKNNTLDHPPYVPGGQDLFNGTICLSAKQFLSTHYNLHNLYASMETRATNKAMASILGRRPFVLSRGSYSGHGFYGAHWSGDVHSLWQHLRYSVQNMINFNMYGIPMIGTDICGFVGNTTVELCTRWMQLGSFYPFSRNHNDKDTTVQDPASYNERTWSIMRNILRVRYSLLPFMYTRMYLSHKDGIPAIRPLFFEFPKDAGTFENDRQFLWGSSLLVIPVLEEGATEVTMHLPISLWYDFFTGQSIEGKGQNMSFPTPLEEINILLRAGHVVPAQDPLHKTTTKDSRLNPFQLLVALDSDGRAEGDLYWDDGDSIDSVTGKKFNLLHFITDKNTLKTTVIENGYKTKMELNRITVFGVANATGAFVNSKSTTVHFDITTKLLQINAQNISLLNENTISWF